MTDKRIRCDLCEALLLSSEAHLWWAGGKDPATRNHLHKYWITCPPAYCRQRERFHWRERMVVDLAEAVLAEQSTRMLYDAPLTHIAGRFTGWTRDFLVSGEDVAKLALRMWPAWSAARKERKAIP
jgi:hypothetical protein